MKKIVPRYIATTLLKIKNKIIKATREKDMRGRHLVSLSAERQEGEFSAEMKDKNIDF